MPSELLMGGGGCSARRYPPRQKAASFTVDQVLETLQDAHGK
jgi:hypothetical protein